MITIRRMESGDTAQIARLESLCFSDPWSERSVSSELTNPLSLWLVALDGDCVVGYIGSQSVLDSADMMNLAVSPDHRREGIGQALTQELSRILRENGVKQLMLEVRASNQPAQRLYEKMGFTHAGCRKNYYTSPKEDAYILRKELLP